MFYEDRIQKLRDRLTLSTINHDSNIMTLNTLKDAHIYCAIHNVSSQQYGTLIEKYIRTKFDYVKNSAKDCAGDCSKDGKNAEIKVSLGGASHKKYNYVQIRPFHDCDNYIFTAYHLSFENVEFEGELYVFQVPKEEIKTLILAYGGYAHGTIKEHGKMTFDSLNDETNTIEYALRPCINDKCWNALLPFRISEYEL